MEQFITNEINGNILLDITLEDLDYMGITALGHRKTILKGAEDLRVNRRMLHPPNPPPISPLASPIATNESVAAVGVARERRDIDAANKQSNAGATKTHWSLLEPLSKNEVT